MKSVVRRMMGRATSTSGGLAYEDARDLARHSDNAVRCQLAMRPDIRPEILYFLAADPVSDVRLQIAANAATPAQANLLLAKDGDERVRCELAGKIARLLPGLPPDAHNRVRDITIQVLEILARDQLSRVRQIVAETLKDVANVPDHVIRWLAHDTDLAVSAPVLQFSPLLTDNDLVEIIDSAPVQGVLAAIASRHGLSAGLCDALVTTDDAEAIAKLLTNNSAQMREETLDYVVERSRQVTGWQNPLVRRLRLPRGLVRKLAEFVADSLLAVLVQRTDLPREVLQDVTAVVHRRLGESRAAAITAHGGKRDQAAPESGKIDATAQDTAKPDQLKEDGAEPDESAQSTGKLDRAAMREKGPKLLQYVQHLYAIGELDEEAINEVLEYGYDDFITLALATKAGVAATLVSRVITARSAKGMTALCWKAGLSMRCAIKLQIRIARVRSNEVLSAKNGTDYPMAPEEMNRLINFFSE